MMEVPSGRPPMALQSGMPRAVFRTPDVIMTVPDSPSHLDRPAGAASTGAASSEDRQSGTRAVCIRFSASQQPRLRRPEPDRCGDGHPIWTERPLLLRRADGTLYLLGISAHLEGLARWILSFAGDAEVESPPALRDWVRTSALEVLDRYDGDTGTTWLRYDRG
jgi:hypothetical protein